MSEATGSRCCRAVDLEIAMARPGMETKSKTPPRCELSAVGGEKILVVRHRTIPAAIALGLAGACMIAGCIVLVVMLLGVGAGNVDDGLVEATRVRAPKRVPIGALIPLLALCTVLAGVLLTWASSHMWGIVRIRIGGSELGIFRGIGAVGLTRRIPIADIRGVRRVTISRRNPASAIRIDGARPMEFGTLLSDSHRKWLIDQLQILLPVGGNEDVDLAHMPVGCFLISEPGRTVVTASVASLGRWLGLTGIFLFWNGIVSFFLLGALGGLYVNLAGPLPRWYPITAPLSEGKPMSLGLAIGMLAFLTPFVVIGVCIGMAMLMALAGKVRVVIQRDRLELFAGIGRIGRERITDPGSITDVREAKSAWRVNGRTVPIIEIRGKKTMAFGADLSEENRRWVLAVLRKHLLKPAAQGDSRAA